MPRLQQPTGLVFIAILPWAYPTFLSFILFDGKKTTGPKQYFLDPFRKWSTTGLYLFIFAIF